MAKVKVTNTTSGRISLPAPFGRILIAGESATFNRINTDDVSRSEDINSLASSSKIKIETLDDETIDNNLEFLSAGLQLSDQTQGPITLKVSPSGSDRTTRVYSGEASPFRTLQGALDALPSFINHAVEILLKPGVTHTISKHIDMRRFIFDRHLSDLDASGGAFSQRLLTIRPEENLYTRVSGTSEMSVASGSQDGITLDADPGFTDNQYQGRFLRVVSGAGADDGKVWWDSGDIFNRRAIRNHSGTGFNIAGNWSVSNPDGTSIVEIVEPAVKLDSPQDEIEIIGQLVGTAFNDSPPIAFRGVEFLKETTVRSCCVLVWDTAHHGLRVRTGGLVRTNINAIKGGSVGIGVWITPSGMVRIGGSNWATLVYDATFGFYMNPFTVSSSSPIQTSMAQGWAGAELFSWCFEDISNDCIHMEGPALCHVDPDAGNDLVNSGVDKVVVLANGARFHYTKSSRVTGVAGTTTDVEIDGVNYTWAEIDAETGDRVLGVEGSFVKAV